MVTPDNNNKMVLVKGNSKIFRCCVATGGHTVPTVTEGLSV